NTSNLDSSTACENLRASSPSFPCPTSATSSTAATWDTWLSGSPWMTLLKIFRQQSSAKSSRRGSSRAMLRKAVEMQEESSSHIIIAGTGRTGTTFLVQYLTELGLDTHRARHGDKQFDTNANAGLEDLPLVTGGLPCVIKCPWIGEYIDEILASPNIKIEAAILPTRDLLEAATSRAILQMRAVHQSAPWMAQQLGKTWENWATTPGGTVFSLNPLDQARILAVGFHRLVQRLVDAEIPITFLGFPRFIEDSNYLFERLSSILPKTVTAPQALAAHQRTAEREKVRVGDELAACSGSDKSFSVVPGALTYPDHDKVDRAALGREIARLDQERVKLAAELEAIQTSVLGRITIWMRRLTNAL